MNNEPSLALFHQLEAFVETRDYGDMFGFNVEGGQEEPAPAPLTPSEGFAINLEEGELFTSLPESFALRVAADEAVVKEWPGITKLAQMFEYYFEFVAKDNLVLFLHEVRYLKKYKYVLFVIILNNFQYLTYWLTKSFPVDALEQLLMDRWDKLNYPLGILLFWYIRYFYFYCKNLISLNINLFCIDYSNNVSKACDLNELNMKIMEPKTILRCFSIHFCMQLCSSVSKSMENKCLFYQCHSLIIMYIINQINITLMIYLHS